jgi:hypothetical protein
VTRSTSGKDGPREDLTLEEALTIILDLCLAEGREFPSASDLAHLAAELVRLNGQEEPEVDEPND